ncbi:MAG: hypothetical protein Q9169_003839 [Polycauliona sp. 2 TL-2023]
MPLHQEDAHKPKSLQCIANCDNNDTTFPSIAAVMEHLEDGTCSKGWTVQHLNYLLVQIPIASPYIIWQHIAYFLAGCPRHQPIDSDFTDRGWKCHLCKASLLSSHDLQRHLEGDECHTRYPDVLQCPHCANQKPGFSRVSELFRHFVEMEMEKESESHASLARQIVEEIRETMDLCHEGSPEEVKVLHQLRIDASKGSKRDLIVKVSMKCAE